MKKIVYFAIVATAVVLLLPSPEQLLQKLDKQLADNQAHSKEYGQLNSTRTASDSATSTSEAAGTENSIETRKPIASSAPENYSEWIKTPEAQTLIESGLADQALAIARSEQFSERQCTWSDAGEVEEAERTEIYQWRDADGRLHFGDKNHAEKRAASQRAKKTHYTGQKQFFDIAIKDQSNLPKSTFQQTLNGRISKVYEILADHNHQARSYIGSDEQDPKVELNLWLFSEQRDYLNFQRQHAPMLNMQSQGFHYPPKNIAATWVRNPEQGMTTSVHEAVHVINNGLYGWLERWLNEGMAEYFQDIQVTGQSAHVSVKARQLKWLQAQGSVSLSELNQLTLSDWQGTETEVSKRYVSSWLAVHFLMDEPDLRRALFEFLIETSNQPCLESKSLIAIGKKFPGGLIALDQRFLRWQDGIIDGHAY